MRSACCLKGLSPGDETKALLCFARQIAGAIAVLDVGGQDGHAEQMKELVDADVAVAAGSKSCGSSA